MAPEQILPTKVSPLEADRIKAFGFDKQPERVITEGERAEIRSVLDERVGEYVYGGAHGWALDSASLAGVVADIVYAALRRDRETRGEVPQ